MCPVIKFQILILLVLAGLSQSTIAGSSLQCARYCKEDADNFAYDIDKSYVYTYSATLRTLINSTNNQQDESKVLIESEVTFQHLSRCDYLMQITDVTIRDSDIAKSNQVENVQRYEDLQRHLKESPIRFSFNGKIETICADEEEIKEVTDLKRGILTLFQNSNSNFKSNALIYETDITGSCETVFKVSTVGTTKFVEKFKDLSSCDHRLSQYLSWQSVPYVTSSKVKSLPLLKSVLNCQLIYGPHEESQGDILLDATCSERHAFQPFSNGDNGVVTIGEQHLRLLSVNRRIDEEFLTPSKPIHRTSLLFEHVHSIGEEVMKDTREALKILDEIEEKTADGVEVEAPRLFTNLVQEFQQLSKTQLLDIFNKTNANQRKMFIDVISLLRTSFGIEVMVQLYQEQQVTPKQMNSWLVSLNFLKNPTKKTLQVIYPLNFNAEIKKNAFLALSSILYKYCSKQSNCLDDVVVFEIVKNIERPLLNNCRPSSTQTVNDIQLALKTIGNAGIVSSYYNLQSCYLNEDLPTDLRLSAITAHRRMNCAENENLDDFMNLLADAQGNCEIRIAAYLASMQCASYSTFAQVKDVLLKEEANQVGSFIWTHITNLQETSVPWKQSIRKLIENEFLKNKFNTDIRKYSRNYEASTFLDAFGVGGGVETNVIFTPESYLPRSAMLNFTVDLFGQSMNVLELGTRMEGFEDIVENLFGPNGYFSPTSAEADSEEASLERGPMKPLFGHFNEKFQVLPREPTGSVSVKIFGNEISYTELHDLQDLLGVPNSGNEAFDMLMQFLSKNGVEYTKSFSFLDTSFRLPTILGFPLQLKAIGSATVGLTAGGEMHMKDLWRNKMLVKGKVYPSAAVQIRATMSVDTYAGEAGLQYVGTMNTNTYIDGYANIELGKIVEVKINVPKKQMDIFSATSDIYLIYNDRSIPIRDLSPQIESSEYCTNGYIAKTIGMQWCNHWRYVNASSVENTPNFPFTGSFRYSCHVRKTDDFDYFHLHAETHLTQTHSTKKPYLINFLLDTPGSNVDRKIQALVSVDLNEYKLNANIHTPMGTFTLHSNIERNANLPKYNFQLLTSLNNKEIVTLQSTFDVKDEGAMVTYEPDAKLNYKQQQIVAIRGKLSHVKGGDFSADLNLEGAMNDFAQIYGSFNCSSEHFHIQTNILSSSLKGQMEAAIKVLHNEIRVSSSTNYAYSGEMNQSIEFHGHYTKNKIVSSGNMSSNSFNLNLKTSEFPQYNTEIAWINQRASMFFNNTAELKLFETSWKSHQIIKLDDSFTDDEATIMILGDLQCLEKNIDYRAEASYSRSRFHLKTRTLLQLNPIQRYEVLVDFQTHAKLEKLLVLIYYPRNEVTFEGNISKRSKTHDFNFNCRHKTPQEEYVLVTLRGDYLNSSLGEMHNHKVTCILDTPAFNGELKTPWHIEGNVQKSQMLFMGYAKVTTKTAEFVGHLNWMDENLALSIHANDKALLIINGARNEDMLNIGLVLNIYQFIELTAKLVHPYQSFDVQFYWDKDRDDTKRFLLGVRRNAFRGEYTMNIEYPNQRILTNVILIPTQVTMNVTWGVIVSQKIYLKLGNKVYDSGGLWFGELETPFRYLEKQQFNLKYYVDSYSFDVQSDLSWRNHIINLILVGSRLESIVSGTMKLNTTLHEIRYVGADLKHVYEDQPALRSHKTTLGFDYNEHSINVISKWWTTGDKVNANFRIDSTTQTFQPIYGQLDLNNDSCVEANKIHAVLSWQKKNITALYNYNSETSSITLLTPFEGFKKSIIQYVLIANEESLHIGAMMDIFEQNNSIALDWANTAKETALTLSFTSPMTGSYHLVFTHGRRLFELNENVLIQVPNDKDILRVTIVGNIMNGNISAVLVLLDQEAKLGLAKVSSSPQNIEWNAEAQLNEIKINSILQIHYDDSDNLSLFNVKLVSDSFSSANIYLRKTTENPQSTLFVLQYSDVFLVQNNFTYAIKSQFENNLNINLPNLKMQLRHSHIMGKQLDQMISAILNEGQFEIGYNLIGNMSHSEAALEAQYNFKQNAVITHALRMNSKLQKTSMKESLIIEMNSNPLVWNGLLLIERWMDENSRKLFYSKVHLIPFVDFEIESTRDGTVIMDHLLQNTIRADYTWLPNKISTQLISNYDSIRNSSFFVDWSQNKTLKIRGNWDEVAFNGKFSQEKVLVQLVKNDTKLAEFIMMTKGLLELKLDVMMLQTHESSLNYKITPDFTLFLNYTLKTPLDNIIIETMYSNSKLESTLKVNGKLYSGYLDQNCLYGGNFKLTKPDDYYDGTICITRDSLNTTLSTATSKNWFAASIFALNMRSDYFMIPETTGEIAILHEHQFEGFLDVHTNTTNQHFNISGGYQGPNIWLTVYQPNREPLLIANITLKTKCIEDIDISLHLLTPDKKFKFDLRNIFADDYRTALELITPFDGWSRISFDCNVNNESLGISVLAKNRQFLLMARRSGSNLLLVEYHGETLMEITSSEGVITLRTTNKLGKYRMMVQSTSNPGIYVFSILREGENLVSFMLQNVSSGKIKHFKGKLMAPGMIPNNATMAIELQADLLIWKLFRFQFKKDQRPIIDLGWEAKMFDYGFDSSINFHSEIEGIPSFWIISSVDVRHLVAVKYLCTKHTECELKVLISDKHIECISKSPIDMLTFHLFANQTYNSPVMETNLFYNDSNRNLLSFHIIANEISSMLRNQEGIFKADLKFSTTPRTILENNLDNTPTRDMRVYFLGELNGNEVTVDFQCPEGTFYLTARGNRTKSWGTSSLTFRKLSKNYVGSWTAIDTAEKREISASLKEDYKHIGTLSYTNILERGKDSMISDISLHGSFNEYKMDSIMSATLTKDSAKVIFSVFMPFKHFPNIKSQTILKLKNHSTLLEQYLSTANNEYSMQAKGTHGHVDIFYKHSGTTFNESIKNLPRRKPYTSKWLDFRFLLDLDQGRTYVVDAHDTPTGGYSIQADSKDGKSKASLKLEPTSLNLELQLIGGIESVILKMNSQRFMLATWINDHIHLTFSDFSPRLAFGCLVSEVDANLIPMGDMHSVIYKSSGSKMPKVHFLYGLYKSYGLLETNEDIAIFKFPGQGMRTNVIYDADEFSSMNVEIQNFEHSLNMSVSSIGNSYIVDVRPSFMNSGILRVDQNFTDAMYKGVYQRFDILFISEMYKLRASPEYNQIEINDGELKVNFTYNKNSESYFHLTTGEDHRIVIRKDVIDIAIKEVFKLNVDLKGASFLAFYKYDSLECYINASSPHNALFSLRRNNISLSEFQYLFDGQSFKYYSNVPRLDILSLVDLQYNWTNSVAVKQFFGHINIDSQFAGHIRSNGSFLLKRHLLDVEVYTNAPFLDGHETFYGKVYIPANFRPHVDVVMPNCRYKLRFDHDGSLNQMQAELIYINQKTFILSADFDAYLRIIKLNITFPDPTFNKFWLETNETTIEGAFNDDYYGTFGTYLSGTELLLKTPLPEFSKIGYKLIKKFEEDCLDVGILIEHPQYEKPLGVQLQVNHEKKALGIMYNIHLPFEINIWDGPKDYFLLKTQARIDSERSVNAVVSISSNDVDSGAEIDFILESQQDTEIKLRAHLNKIHYITELILNSSTVRFVMVPGVHLTSTEVAILTNGPFHEQYVSASDILVFHLSFENERQGLLVNHKEWAFSLQRDGHKFLKSIWDLRKPNETSLGFRLQDNEGEMFVFGNTLSGQYNFDSEKTFVKVIINNACMIYESQNTSKYLGTPFGHVYLFNHVTPNSEYIPTTLQKPYLIVGRRNLGPHLNELSLRSSALPGEYPLVLTLDLTHFATLASVIDARLSYASDEEKTLQFRMTYNASDNNGMAMTERIFQLTHRASKIDYELFFTTHKMPEFSNGSIILRYRDFDAHRNEQIKASVKVDHMRFGVSAAVLTSKNRLSVMATSTTGFKWHGFQTTMELNDKDPLNMECTYNFKQENPSMSLMIAHGSSRKFIFYAGLPNEREIIAKMGHESYGRVAVDAFATVRLNTSQLLWMKVLWKENMFSPLQEAIFDEYTDLRYVIEAVGRQLIEVIHDDVGKALIEDIADMKKHAINETLKELAMLSVSMQKNLQCDGRAAVCSLIAQSAEVAEVISALRGNLQFLFDFFVRTMSNSLLSLQALCDVVDTEMQGAIKDIRSVRCMKLDAEAILKKGISSARRSLKDMEAIAVKLLDDVDTCAGHAKENIETFFEPFLSLMDDFVAYVEQRLTMLQVAVIDMVETVQKYIFDLREIKAVYSVYYSYVNWLEELHIVDILEPIGDVIEEMLDTIIKDVKRVLDHYKPYLDALGDVLLGKYDGLRQLPPVAELREYVHRVYYKTVWVWNYHNMTEGLKTAVRRISKDMDRVLSLVEFDELAQEDLDHSFGYSYVIRPENRLIEISQPLPVEWEAFNKSPSFEHYPLYQRIQGKSEQFIKFYKSRYDLIDMLETFVADLYEPSIAPATFNCAMIIGKSQYSTFNGVNYNFLSNCSYLLATDFKTKSFSLIVNYRANQSNGSHQQKSYEIVTNDMSFEIFGFDRITLNGHSVDLPIVHKQVTITREHETIIAESSRGFKMVCNFHYDFCTVQLSGWLFGKTAGLLGTLDNEQFTDISSSRRGPTRNISEFLDSWKLSDDNCNVFESPDLTKQPLVVDYVAQLCELLFNDRQSPLKKCFDSIDPKPFAEMCLNEIKANPELKVCAPVAAYVYRCRKAKVVIDMPELCVTCTDDIGYTEEIFDGHNNKTIDVVFITELDCFTSNESMITELPELLDEYLNLNGFLHNRYASVGYGGTSLPKPHFNTFGGKIWAASTDITITTHLSGGNQHKKAKFTAIDAIKYATTLQFRVGVSKLFILMQCEVATDVSNSPDIYNMLGEKDITLHVLKPAPFARPADKVLGITMFNSIIEEPRATETPQTINKTPPNEVNQIIRGIRDVYSGLALSTNGSIFDSNKIFQSRPYSTKWVTTVSENIRKSPCQKCKCIQDVNGVGRIECSRCLTLAVKQFLHEYEEGHKMIINDNDLEN